MNLFCVCGGKTEYSGTRPRFCGACGNPFDAAFKRIPLPVYAPAAIAAVPALASQPRYILAPPEPSNEIPVLSADCVSMESEAPHRLTVGSVLKNPDMVSSDRPMGRASTPEGCRSIDSIKDEVVAGMTRSAPVAAPAPAPSRPSRRKRA